MQIIFDSKSPQHKKPFGCVRENENIEITVHIPSCYGAKTAFINIFADDSFNLTVPMTISRGNGFDIGTASFSIYRRGLYFYNFTVKTESEQFTFFKKNEFETALSGEAWQLSVIPSDFKTPDEFKGNVIYQIYPDRFYKDKVLPNPMRKTPYVLHSTESECPAFLPDVMGEILNNDFFGGNLKGIEKKLSYLKDLGIETIYLNPIFEAYSNHRYDTANYKKIDPLLGQEKDFISLCEKAHKLGIKIILDGVFSHTGSDSIYFDKDNFYGEGAYNNENSPYASWYQFSPDKSTYASWWGIKTLPCVNELDPSYLSYIIEDEDSVIAHWLRLGADGFRLDVADELPDEFIKRLRRRVKEVKPGAIVIGEVWEDASNKISYSVRRKYFTDNELDSVMNYPFRDNIIAFMRGEITAEDFSKIIMTIVENYPEEVLHCLMNSLSTHDTVRILTRLSDVPMPQSREERAYYTLSGYDLEKAIAKVKVASVLQFTLPGCPTIYYGDEAGLEGYEDPFNRRFYPWGNENKDLLEFTKKLASLKKALAPLKLGNIHIKWAENGYFMFERYLNGESVYIAVNRGDAKYLEAKDVIFSEGYENNTLSENGFVIFKTL